MTFDEASTFTDGKLHAYYGSPKKKYGKNGNEIPEISSFFKKRVNKKFKSFSKALSNIQGSFKTVRMEKRTGRQ